MSKGYREVTLERLINSVDPTFRADRRKEREYVFGGGSRTFYANPTRRGAYAPEDDPGYISASGGRFVDSYGRRIESD